MKRPLAYITAAWCGDPDTDMELAARYCRMAYEAGFSPICPILYLPLFINDAIPEEHKNGIDMEDVMVEVTEEVAEELLAGQRHIKASRRRIYRNKAHYSLDAEDGIEYSACFSNPSPQELIERMERFEYLCHALNSLPDAQGQRVFEHYLLNHSVKAIAAAEGVTERAINAAIQRGLENMKKYLEKVL